MFLSQHIKHNHEAANPRQQKGAALITSLLILILFTIIGLSGIQTTILEEKMANNYRDSELSFQSAESALAFGENKIETFFTENAEGQSVLWKNYLLSSSATNTCGSEQSGNLAGTCGPYAEDNSVLVDFDPFAANAWDNAPSIPASSNTNLYLRSSGGSNTLQAPKYIIQAIRKDSTTNEYIFNVYAKGVGADTDAITILRSTYIKK